MYVQWSMYMYMYNNIILISDGYQKYILHFPSDQAALLQSVTHFSHGYNRYIIHVRIYMHIYVYVHVHVQC